MNYRTLALSDLAALGFTPDGLIKRYPIELNRFRLACDMGELGFELLPVEANADPLEPAARAWLELASAWPPIPFIEGIELPILESAFTFKVKANGMSLRHIPPHLQSEAIKIEAVSQDGWALINIPVAQQTETIRLKAVAQHGRALRYIPAEIQSEEVRLTAVTQDGWALEFIPQNEQSEAVRLAALINDRNADRYMPDKEARRLLKKIAQHSNDLSP